MRLLGHEFRPMVDGDFEAFAGAEADSLICERDDFILIWSPQTQTLTEVAADGSECDWVRGTLR